MDALIIRFGYVLLVFLVCLSAGCSFVGKEFTGGSAFVPEHQLWDSLLNEHVTDSGLVDYKGFLRDSAILNEYLELLGKHVPDKNKWSEEERLSYWINAYNAFTVQLILRHYPLRSIKDIAGKFAVPFINSSWDISFISIGNERVTLNLIEHGILRKEFEEPRIHFAINCASMSCPVLRREAYRPKDLDKQLEEQAILFINDPFRNKIHHGDKAELSKIFSWFEGDFAAGKPGNDIRTYINRYSEITLYPDAKITYLDYNWALNESEQ